MFHFLYTVRIYIILLLSGFSLPASFNFCERPLSASQVKSIKAKVFRCCSFLKNALAAPGTVSVLEGDKVYIHVIRFSLNRSFESSGVNLSYLGESVRFVFLKG